MVRVVPEYKEEARRRILQKAVEIFAEHGYHATTMDDIAHAVGVSKGAIYLYFDSKETLFAEMVAWKREEGLYQARAYFSSLTGKDVLEPMFEHWLSLMDEHFIRLSLEITSLSYQNPRLREILREDREQDFKILASLLDGQQKEGRIPAQVNISLLSQTIWFFMNGLFFALSQGLDRDDARDSWNEMIRCWLQD